MRYRGDERTSSRSVRSCLSRPVSHGTSVSGARPSVSFRAVDAEAVARVLASAPVFSALSETERGELVAHLRPRRFARDEVVFHRDDAAGHVYLILSGSVKVSIPDE